MLIWGAKVEIFQIGWKERVWTISQKGGLELTKGCCKSSAIVFTFTGKQPVEENQNVSSFKQLFQESTLKLGYVKNIEQIIN